MSSALALLAALCIVLCASQQVPGQPVTFDVAGPTYPCPNIAVCRISAMTVSVPIISAFAEITITSGELSPNTAPLTTASACQSFVAIPDVDVVYRGVWNATTISGSWRNTFGLPSRTGNPPLPILQMAMFSSTGGGQTARGTVIGVTADSLVVYNLTAFCCGCCGVYTITCPAPIVQPTDPGVCGAIVRFSPTVPLLCPNIITVAPLASGAFFPLGRTNQVYTISDTDGSSPSQCSFPVTVVDRQPPTVTCPADVTVPNDVNTCSGVATFALPTVTDNCPSSASSLVQTQGLPSGSIFPLGSTIVAFRATDASGQSASCQFTVTVRDTQAPRIVCPPNVIVQAALGTCQQVVSYNTPVGTDNCPGATTIQTGGLTSGSSFPVGVTVSTFQTTDAAGNAASCSFTVTVRDLQLPVITCPPPIFLVPALPMVVNYVSPVGQDNCPGAVTTRTSGLPSGAVFPAGVTLVTFAVVDASGLSASCTLRVTISNPPPLANNDTRCSTTAQPLVIPVLDNDSGDFLPSSVRLVVQPWFGVVSVGLNGVLTYVPQPASLFSFVDVFSYEVCSAALGCDSAFVTVTVLGVGVCPTVVAPDALITTPLNTPVLVPNPAAPLTPTIVTPPLRGTLTAQLLYTPAPGFTGVDSFQYQVCNGPASCAVGTITIVVFPLNSGPLAVDDWVLAQPGVPVTVNVVSNDAAQSAPLVFSSVVVIAGASSGQAVANGDGTITYTPLASFVGLDSFSYRVFDSAGRSSSAVVHVSVRAAVPNPPPPPITSATSGCSCKSACTSGGSAAVVPSVVGRPIDEASSALWASKLSASIRFTTGVLGQVIAQQVDGGSIVGLQNFVAIDAGDGSAALVANTIGLRVEEALALLLGQRLAPSVVFGNGPLGIVLGTVPAPGSPTADGRPIVVIVGNGGDVFAFNATQDVYRTSFGTSLVGPPCSLSCCCLPGSATLVPYVVGIPLESGLVAICSAELNAQVFWTNGPLGSIMSQWPAAGTAARRSVFAVALTVGNGHLGVAPPVQPQRSLLGLPLVDAVRAIVAQGWPVVVAWASGPLGVVVGQQDGYKIYVGQGH